ncbi:MAG: hypothetical protein ACLFV6_02900 [Spirulinaceae cyanobacterium]
MNLVIRRIIILGIVVAGGGIGWACSAFDSTISTEEETVLSQNDPNYSISFKDKANAHSTAEIPEFSGQIGHYEASQPFTDFIFEHQNELVFIDAYYLPEFWDEIEIINDSFGVDYFHLWHNCGDSLEPNEAPSYQNCTGTGFSLDRDTSPKDADFTFIRDVLRIQGYFAIRGCDGPHQGSMGCTLRPLNPEDL